MTRAVRRALTIFAVVVVALVVADAVGERVGAHAIVDAPNRGRDTLATASGERRVAVDGVTLAVAVDEPRGPARATVFCLHGIRDRKESLAGWAARLTAAGYRAVRVDSRGHGGSTGDWLTYGVEESRDLSALVDALQPSGPLAVIGVSYGGATAVEWAAREPRLRAAVAVAPFASLREIVPPYLSRLVPLGGLVPRFVVARTLARAGRLAAFDPDAASPRAAVASLRAPLLVLHGTRDDKIPYAQAEEIVAAAGGRARLVPLDGQDHDHVAGDARLWPPVLDFLARELQ